MRPKKKILLVDSDPARLEVRRFLLETRGFRVHALPDAREALEYLRGVPVLEVDLLLSELLLTGMDGDNLVRRAKELHPALPALLVSNTVSARDRALAADSFLPKGACSNAELVDRVRVLTARKRGPRPAAPPVHEERVA